MKILNMDFSKKVMIKTSEESWVNDPESGVKKIPLQEDETESSLTTSVMEYKKGASFKKKPKLQGEEIFVLEGTLSDEYGDYKAGTYIRNPPGSAHKTFSKDGCKIFVKLNQIDQNDKSRVVIDTTESNWIPGHEKLKVLPLHSFGTEGTALVKWPAGEHFIKHRHFGGEEIFVLKGEFLDEHGKYPQGTWIRSPHMSVHDPYVERDTIIFVKTGHL